MTRFLLFALFVFGFPPTLAAAGTEDFSNPVLELFVTEITDPFPPYAEFCARDPQQCEMTGPAVIEMTDGLLTMLREVNSYVNSCIHTGISDQELYGFEEYWAIPDAGYGDCEDIALAKRAALVKRGLPRAAMTMAIVHHKRTMMPHAVLLVETASGTFILNSFTDQIVLWHEAPFNYEARERTDGKWERYDQHFWTYD